MNGSCHCGGVEITVPAPPPFLNACNCTLCYKLGALWGYYAADAVAIDGRVESYQRNDVDPPLLNAHFCGRCGTTTHWSATEHLASGRIGINMRLFDPAVLEGIELRHGDRRHHALGSGRSYRAPTIFKSEGLA